MGASTSSSLGAVAAATQQGVALATEKAAWLEHAKAENAVLVKLLHDVRAGKRIVQDEVNKLENERNGIKVSKMDGVANGFDRLLAEMPLGRKGSAGSAAGAVNFENQHKTDSIHALMCSIAKRCRARQETYISEVLDLIKEAEESFLAGGDIAHKINNLKLLGEGVLAGAGGAAHTGANGGGGASNMPPPPPVLLLESLEGDFRGESRRQRQQA